MDEEEEEGGEGRFVRKVRGEKERKGNRKQEWGGTMCTGLYEEDGEEIY